MSIVAKNGDMTVSPGPAEADEKAYILSRDRGATQRWHTVLVLVIPALALIVAADGVIAGKTMTWEVSVAVTLYFLTLLGITVGFHRLLAHRSFKTNALVKATLVILGCMAAQGPPIYWVSNHRRHHRFSDLVGDPHSPLWTDERSARNRLEGWWHAHVGWLLSGKATNSVSYCKDLFQDRIVNSLNRRYHLWLFLGLVIPALVGALIERSLHGAWVGFVWGGGVRLFFSYHFTNSINSLTHMFGRRSFATRENSRNNVWLAGPTLGEAWHNNHHAYPSSAYFGFRWWQIDIGGWLIWILEKGGIVSDVVRPDSAALDKLRIRRSEGR